MGNKLEILVSSSNKHKLKEIEDIMDLQVVGISSKIKEDGRTFEANAIKKVKAIKLKPGQIAIADDSGLMVDCLGGKPGVRSARFAIPPTPKNLCEKLLNVMRLRGSNRRARFVCVIAVKYSNGKIKTVKGVCPGKIIHEMRGSRGFGYDPVFVPKGYKKTFGEMKPATKNRLSHRARALKKLKAIL